ncbi:MAG TPA: phosphoenolpyruvate carboxykinase [Hyphomicrobiaceae bacterium]|nr:phosphoenolpyruvate carboxykinase [Hyphomicrobiaceae bacterium]
MPTETFPLSAAAKVQHNTSAVELIECAVRRREGRLASTGAFVAETGVHTGRSVADKFTVRDSKTESEVWWQNNHAIAPSDFARLREDFSAYASSRELFVQDLHVGADPRYRINCRIYCEYAWHAAFIRHLLRRPTTDEIKDFRPEYTVVYLPLFKADPRRHGVRSETVIACDFTNNLVLIGGTCYAGEAKKSVFTFMNYVMPERGVMPMHCSANVGTAGDSALFFGLSGTGKTTLSADPKRILIGDDEHGWSDSGIFNFEGGCYAKCVNLSATNEPEIWAATNRFGAILENVVLKPGTADPDYEDQSLTENTRSAYPIEFIPNASNSGMAGHPKNIFMLAADAFGVLPPIAKLTPSQAMYHFLSGYTAKVAGTEKGLGSEPEATFSTCFGHPFLPRHPSIYGNMLRELIARHKVDCWLVNTGWTGGIYGIGHRMPIKVTRALLDAALSGALKSQPMRIDPVFGFQVPTTLPGIDARLLSPRDTWADPAAYDATARKLVGMFNKNFVAYEDHVDAEVRSAGPHMKEAAE